MRQLALSSSRLNGIEADYLFERLGGAKDMYTMKLNCERSEWLSADKALWVADRTAASPKRTARQVVLEGLRGSECSLEVPPAQLDHH